HRSMRSSNSPVRAGRTRKMHVNHEGHEIREGHEPPKGSSWPSFSSCASWFLVFMSAGISAFAQTSYEAPPFDSVHLNVPEISSAGDWYLKNMGGNAGETADRVAFGRWSGDHPLPLQLIFEISSDSKPSAGSAIDSIGFSYMDLDAKIRELEAAGVKVTARPEK